MRWTREQLDAYLASRGAGRSEDQDSGRGEAAEHQHAPKCERAGKNEDQEADSGKVFICVTSYSRRPRDPHEQMQKHHIDCLRYAGLIRDDTSKEITLEVRQERKVKTKQEERTEIEVVYGE